MFVETDVLISGGLGLTGGLVDAGNLFDCLNGIHKGLADDNILSRYDEVRRHMYHNVIDPISSENLRRLWQDPDKVLEEDKFLEICRRAETDPELSRQLQTVGPSMKKFDALSGINLWIGYTYNHARFHDGI